MDFRHRLAALIIRGRYIIPVLLLFAAVFAGLSIYRTRINYDLTRYLSADTMTIRGARVMQQEFPAADAMRKSNDNANSGRDLQLKIGREIPIALGVSVAVVLAMLLLTSHAWLEPLLILAVLAISILINMGTNFIFPDVSFITFAVCAILQLALSIDYAIMLLHAWNSCLDDGMSPERAMEEALAECFMRIFSSAMTTVAGLLSLLFMSFTIGFDIGMVLSKGIVISMLCVFLLMPSLVLLTEKALRRTRHRPLSIRGDRLAVLIWRVRRPLAACMTLLVLAGLVLNSRVTYTFTEKASAPAPMVLLVPGGDEDADFDRQRNLVSRLEALTLPDGTPAVSDIQSMVTTGESALRYYTCEELSEAFGLPLPLLKLHCLLSGIQEPFRADRLLDSAGLSASLIPALREKKEQLDTARSLLLGPEHALIVMQENFLPSDPDFNRHMERLFAEVRAVYGDDFYATGMPVSTYDISHAFRSDLLKVNLLTLAAIFLIVALSFRSLRMPVLLVFVIEGAIWLTIGFSRLIHEPVFFISYLICVSIQMGATIDYGILLADQYRSRRAENLPPREAMAAALKKSLPTILTSGIILIVAGFAVGRVCTIYYISSIGLLVSRGALISSLLMLVFLPSLLLLFDSFVIRRKAAG